MRARDWLLVCAAMRLFCLLSPLLLVLALRYNESPEGSCRNQNW